MVSLPHKYERTGRSLYAVAPISILMCFYLSPYDRVLCHLFRKGLLNDEISTDSIADKQKMRRFVQDRPGIPPCK